MNKKQLSYYFNYIDKCNFCHSSGSTQKVLGRRLNRSHGKNPKNKIGISTTIIKCKSCELIYSNPLPIPFNIQDHYGVLPENYWQAEYLNNNANFFKTEIRVLKGIIDIKPGMRSLDVGSGIGKVMRVLQDEGFDSYGIEPSQQFYQRAISNNFINAEKLTMSTVESAEYPENHFDFITFGAVLEHLYYPSEVIIKALKWLKPNGIIHIEVPSSNWLMSKLFNLYYKIILTNFVTNLSPMHNPYHLYEFSIKSFKKHAEQHGYEIVTHKHYVSYTYLPRFLDFIIKPIMKWTNTGMLLSIWLRKK